MKIRKLLIFAALIGLLSCYGCGKTEVKPASGETSVSQEASSESSESSEASEEEAAGEEGINYSEVEPEPAPEELIDYGDYYSEVVVTGIEEWDAVGYSIAGFMDGSLFQLEYVDENGEEISGDYTPGTPDKIVFEFDNKTGEAVSAVYYGTYPDADSVALGIEALDANSYLMGDDVIGIVAEGNNIVIAFNPKSARFNNTIRTYFLEGKQDPAGYTEAVEKDYESSSRDKSTLKGDNFACDSINGLKVTWYK